MRDITGFEEFLGGPIRQLHESKVHLDAVDKRIADLQNYRERYAAFHAELDRRMDKVRDALKKMGLEQTGDIHVRKTGRDDSAWSEDDSMAASFRAVPVGGKFKFLAFNGYTASGSSKNRERMNEKAKSMADAIKAAAGVTCQVNSASLEVRDGRDSRRVLIDIWVGKELLGH